LSLDVNNDLENLFDNIYKEKSLHYTINPGGFIETVAVAIPQSDTVINALNDPKQTLYLIGDIRYVDAFSGRHVTQFCFVADKHSLDRNNSPLVLEHVRSCDAHNCSDNDCKPEKKEMLAQ
ncbi:MAG: hypothetical protein ABF979_16555, partial [Gluconobacter sp.]|uniref:hypothetical protein n=1 Tax=Gluconobacter sp. TaxID=1876758 RepID=UPI0039EBFA9B